MKVTRQDIIQLSMTKTGKPGSLYTDEDGNTYRALESGALKRLKSWEIAQLEEEHEEDVEAIEADLSAIEDRLDDLERRKIDRCKAIAMSIVL